MLQPHEPLAETLKLSSILIMVFFRKHRHDDFNTINLPFLIHNSYKSFFGVPSTVLKISWQWCINWCFFNQPSVTLFYLSVWIIISSFACVASTLKTSSMRFHNLICSTFCSGYVATSSLTHTPFHSRRVASGYVATSSRMIAIANSLCSTSAYLATGHFWVALLWLVMNMCLCVR